MFKQRPLLWLFASVLVVSNLTGCGGKKAAPSPAPATEPPKILLVGNGDEPKDLDPQVVMGNVEYSLILALFEGLVTTDPKTMDTSPGVAETWAISESGLVYTFHLRDNARWSNGDPVTARDFVRSYQRILTPSLAAEYAYTLFHVVGAEDFYRGKLTDFSKTGFRAIDDSTLEITLHHPTPFFLHMLAFLTWYPVPVSTIEKVGRIDQRGSPWTRPENFVGNGPFVLKEWRPGQKIVVTRSKTYWDRAAVKLDEIHFHPIQSTDTEERMFRTGQLHITHEVPLSKIPVYQRESPDSIRTDPLYAVYFYRFNVKRAPLDNVKVRRALSLAINRESLVKDVLLGGETPAYHIVPPNVAGFASRHQLSGDLAEAKRLLAEAGYPDGKGFPATEILYNTVQKHRAVAEAIQQMWRRNLGIEVTLHNEEWKVYQDTQHLHNYQIARGAWNADYADPHAFLDLWETDAGNNDTQWSNAEYDRLLRASLKAASPEARYEIYQQMEKILLEDLPIMPIYFYTQPRLVSPKVKGYYVTPLDNYPWKHADLAQ
jgi:oligopeptide transport system substrate-binding protein